jgi:TRAP-type C4-dicarboxylate transport system substrate-binding protein
VAGARAKERQVLKSAIETHGRCQDNEILAQEGKLVDTFKAAGMTVIQPDSRASASRCSRACRQVRVEVGQGSLGAHRRGMTLADRRRGARASARR